MKSHVARTRHRSPWECFGSQVTAARGESVRRLYITGTRVLSERQALQKTTGPPGRGLGVGPATPPRKNYQVTETATMNSNPQSPMEISSQAPELGSMTAPSGNPPREAISSRRNFLWPKTMVRLVTWNVRTMFETGKTAQVTKEMERYDVDILGVSECRMAQEGIRQVMVLQFCFLARKMPMQTVLPL